MTEKRGDKTSTVNVELVNKNLLGVINYGPHTTFNLVIEQLIAAFDRLESFKEQAIAKK